MPLRFVVGLMLSLCVASSVQATQVCGWLVETNQPDNVHDFALWQDRYQHRAAPDAREYFFQCADPRAGEVYISAERPGVGNQSATNAGQEAVLVAK